MGINYQEKKIGYELFEELSPEELEYCRKNYNSIFFITPWIIRCLVGV